MKRLPDIEYRLMSKNIMADNEGGLSTRTKVGSQELQVMSKFKFLG